MHPRCFWFLYRFRLQRLNLITYGGRLFVGFFRNRPRKCLLQTAHDRLVRLALERQIRHFPNMLQAGMHILQNRANLRAKSRVAGRTASRPVRWKSALLKPQSGHDKVAPLGRR